jgi:hypothetical protein
MDLSVQDVFRAHPWKRQKQDGQGERSQPTRLKPVSEDIPTGQPYAKLVYREQS